MDKGNPEQAATLEELQAKLEIAEKRHRDTQAAYTKGQQTLKALEAENKLLLDKVGSVTVKDDEELEELKLVDPDKWYEKRKALESQKKQELQQDLSKARDEASTEVELARRAKVLEEFNQSHPDVQLTDELIAYDVPPRLTKQLEKGELTFEEFLDKTYEFLTKPKTVKDVNETLQQPDLGKLGGGATPQDSTTAVDIVASYKKEIY